MLPSTPISSGMVVVAGDPHDVVDPGGHEAAVGGRDVEVRPGPHDAAGVDVHRPQREVAGLVEDRDHQQDVAVGARVEVDEGDARAALDAVLAGGVPRRHQHPATTDVLGVGGVGAGRDALGVPELVALVVVVPAVGLAHRPAEQSGKTRTGRTAYFRSSSSASSPAGGPSTAASASISRTFSSVRCRCTPSTNGPQPARPPVRRWPVPRRGRASTGRQDAWLDPRPDSSVPPGGCGEWPP